MPRRFSLDTSSYKSRVEYTHRVDASFPVHYVLVPGRVHASTEANISFVRRARWGRPGKVAGERKVLWVQQVLRNLK